MILRQHSSSLLLRRFNGRGKLSSNGSINSSCNSAIKCSSSSTSHSSESLRNFSDKIADKVLLEPKDGANDPTNAMLCGCGVLFVLWGMYSLNRSEADEDNEKEAWRRKR